jgi:hypothetical protein
MSTTNFIAIGAILVSLVGLTVTIIGWIVTHQSQKEIAEEQAAANAKLQTELEAVKEQFARDRDQRHLLLPRQIEDLDKIRDWMMEGFRMGGEITSLFIDYKNINVDYIHHLTLSWTLSVRRRQGV